MLFLATSAHAQTVATQTASGQSGWFGQYYNIVGATGAETPGTTSNPVAGPANPWYDQSEFMFSRVDSNINFGAGFAPNGHVDHPTPFAVHWSATMKVPATGSYNIAMGSDDDSWLYIDGSLAVDNNGTHADRLKTQTLTLTAGNHQADIYYAQRNTGSPSGFSFQADPKLFFTPNGTPSTSTTTVSTTPCNCPCATGTGSTAATTGKVLGASTVPYTPAIALYKTATSPAIYAIYANGERHYISSPTAFQHYGYSYNRVKVVTQAVLDRYPEATLLRSREDATVYHLFPRPDAQWLKLAIPSPTVFVSYGKNEWGNIIVVDALDLAYYPNATLVHVTANGPTYLLSDDTSRQFLSEDVLRQLGYNPAEIVQISQTHLNAFAPGEPIG